MASGSRSISKGSEEAFLYECDPCKYQNITSEAKAYCKVCTEHLCQRCEQAHKGSRATRDHKILTGKDIHSVSMTTLPNKPAVFCDIHKTMTVNTYCQDHDDVICSTCKITDHRKCVTTDVSYQKKNVQIIKAIEETVHFFTDLKHSYEKLKDTRKTYQTNVKSQLSKCLEDMRNMRKEINQTFDTLERKFENEVKQMEERMKIEIEDHVKMADDALIKISDQIKSFEEFKRSKNDDVMFVGMKRATKVKSKYDQLLSTLQQAAYPIKIRFRVNDVIYDAMQQLLYIGTLDGIQPVSTSRLKTSSVVQMSVVDKREVGVGTKYVYDCTFMKSGHLFLTRGRDGIVLLDENLKVQSKSSVTSVGVAVINENEVFVTQGRDKKLLRVRLFPKMVVVTTIKMDRWCYGVDVFNDEIFVACNDGNDDGHGEVQVLNMDGKILRKLGANNDEYMFKWIDSVKVSRDGRKIFVSDFDTHKVMCLNQQGHVIYKYSDSDLEFPQGLYVDEDDTLLVCGTESNNIHMVGSDGRKTKVWLTEKDGVVDPLCVAYRQNDGCLVVGLRNKDKPLIAFNTK